VVLITISARSPAPTSTGRHPGLRGPPRDRLAAGRRYVVVQVVGAVLGVWAAHAMFAEPILRLELTYQACIVSFAVECSCPFCSFKPWFNFFPPDSIPFSGF
jgi:hypothetical protein